MSSGPPRRALVTGVSRRRGIGFAVASRLLADGARVFVQSWTPHDVAQPWGADPGGVEAVLAELHTAAERAGPPKPVAIRDRIGHAACDLALADTPAELVARAAERLGGLDTLVAAHARSSGGGLGTLTAGELDLCWAVNVRAVLLLAQAFVDQFPGARRGGAGHDNGGRIVSFTSGQHLGPMPGEIGYAATKGALHQLPLTLGDALVDLGITVNAVNPGPTDTGWADPELTDRIRRAMPKGRWNSPDEAAAVVALLLSPEAATITGQVIDAEGGFRRWTH